MNKRERQRHLARMGLIAVAGTFVGLHPASVAASPQRIEPTGEYTHQPSGTVFPLQVGSFRRLAGVYLYNDDGTDVGVGFRLVHPRGDVELTEYVYPAPHAADASAQRRACHQAFTDAHNDIVATRPKARIKFEKHPAVLSRSPGGLAESRSYLIEQPDAESPMRSRLDLYCYIRGSWLVKYRVSGPAEIDVERLVNEFIAVGPWPSRP